MIDIPRDEWVEMAWAARDKAEATMNMERRAWFEGVKCLLNAPKFKIIPGEVSNVITLHVPEFYYASRLEGVCTYMSKSRSRAYGAPLGEVG